MGGVELEQVEARGQGVARGRGKLLADAVHIAAGQFLRGLGAPVPGQRRGGDERPGLPVGEWRAAAGQQLRRAFAPGVAELDGDLGSAAAVDEVDDAPPGLGVGGAPQPRAARADARLGRDIGHLAHDQPGTAHGSAADVDQVPVVGQAVLGGVLTHGADDDAVVEGQRAQREGLKHRRRCRLGGGDGTADVGGEPPVEAVDIVGVADAQVFVGDPLAAGQQAGDELLRRKVAVASDVLEPPLADRGRALELGDIEAPVALVVLEGRGHVDLVAAGCGLEGRGQLDGVLHGQLGARANRKVGRVGGVAEQHQLAIVPARAAEGGKGDPARAVAEQLGAGELRGEQLLAVGDALGLAGLVEAGAAPRVLVTLDDEGRGVAIEAVGVDLKQAVAVFADNEGEGVPQAIAAEPDEACPAGGDAGLKVLAAGAADGRVDAVGGDDQVAGGEAIETVEAGLVLDAHAELAGPGGEDLEQPDPANAGEVVAARADALTAKVDVDGVPAGEASADLGEALGVGLGEVAHGLLGEDHAPAPGHALGVFFDDRDFGLRPGLFEQDGAVEPRRAASDNPDVHRWSALPSMRGECATAG